VTVCADLYKNQRKQILSHEPALSTYTRHTIWHMWLHYLTSGATLSGRRSISTAGGAREHHFTCRPSRSTTLHHWRCASEPKIARRHVARRHEPRATRHRLRKRPSGGVINRTSTCVTSSIASRAELAAAAAAELAVSATTKPITAASLYTRRRLGSHQCTAVRSGLLPLRDVLWAAFGVETGKLTRGWSAAAGWSTTICNRSTLMYTQWCFQYARQTRSACCIDCGEHIAFRLSSHPPSLVTSAYQYTHSLTHSLELACHTCMVSVHCKSPQWGNGEATTIHGADRSPRMMSYGRWLAERWCSIMAWWCACLWLGDLTCVLGEGYGLRRMAAWGGIVATGTGTFPRRSMSYYYYIYSYFKYINPTQV